jgi:hypothetical protein
MEYLCINISIINMENTSSGIGGGCAFVVVRGKASKAINHVKGKRYLSYLLVISCLA